MDGRRNYLLLRLLFPPLFHTSYCFTNITMLLTLTMSRNVASSSYLLAKRGSAACYNGLGNWDVVWSVVSIAILIICGVTAALHNVFKLELSSIRQGLLSQ
jgi:hypothetical protein